jgi:hypothetical protein
MDVLKPKLGGGSGLLREEFELHVTDRMRVVACIGLRLAPNQIASM